MTLGSTLHSAFDMFYKKFSTEEVATYINDSFNSEISRISPDEQEDVLISKHICLGMWIAFPKELAIFKSIESECEFRVKIPDTEDYFVGRLDGLVKDSLNNLWGRELKTTALSFQQFEKRAKTSAQGTGYVWALKKIGIPAVGMMYDFVKKPLLRKGVNDTVQTFGRRIINDYNSRQDFYFKRHFSYRNDEELKLFENNLIITSKEINDKIKTGNWMRCPENCWAFNSECPYFKICYQEKPDPLTVQVYFNKNVVPNKGGLNEQGE